MANSYIKETKIRKIKPYTKRWEEMANEIARGFAPDIKPCRYCGYPVVDGYCCPTCNSVNP